MCFFSVDFIIFGEIFITTHQLIDMKWIVLVEGYWSDFLTKDAFYSLLSGLLPCILGPSTS